MFCTQCGKQIDEDSRFCTGCGAPVEKRQVDLEPEISYQNTESVPVAAEPVQSVPLQEVCEPAQEAPVQNAEGNSTAVLSVEDAPVQLQSEWQIPAVSEPEPQVEYAQWPVMPQEYSMPEYPPVQQAPVVDVYSDAQFLAAEAEATGKKCKKAKKSKAEKKGKSGKKWVIILAIVIPLLLILAAGGFVGYKFYEMSKTYEQAQAALAEGNFDEALELFESLENFEDSATRAGELKRMQETYDEAMELLENHEFDDAKKLFEELGEYKDAAEMAEYKVIYEKASYVADAAKISDVGALALVMDKDETIPGENTIVEMYRRAAGLFDGLGDYADAEQKAKDCWIAAGTIYLDREAWDDAETLMNEMSDSARVEFNDMFLSCFCDGEALDALTASVEEFNSFEALDANYKAAIDKHISILEDYLDETFREEGVRELLDAYVEGLEAEYKALDKDGRVKDTIAWYKARAQRFTALDELNARYGYLEDNQSLKAKNIGKGEYYANCAAIAEDLNKQANGKQPIEDDQGGLYLEYTNNTDCDFELTYHFVFRDDSGEVGKSESATMEIKAGETVKIPMNVPEDCPEWTRWSFYRSFKIAE